MSQAIFLFVAFILFCPLIINAQSDNYAIEHVSIIPMNKEGVLSNHTILIEKGIIKDIFPSDKATPARYTKIDGTGKFAMPGLFDMHAHFFYEQGDHVNTNEAELKLMLANGITTARIMAGHPSYLEARENVAKGTWIGPELKVVSPQFAGQWPFPTDFKNYVHVKTNEEAIAAVRQFKREGYDAIKLTFKLTPELYQAIVKTAADEKLQVVGHVGPLVMLPAALKAKEQIEHMDMFIEMLLPDTTYNHGQSVSDYNIYSAAAWSTIPHMDRSLIPVLAKKVKESGIYVTPTNYFFIDSFGLPPTDEEIKAKPDYLYIPSALREEKWKYRAKYLKNMATLENREKYVALRKEMVYELWKQSVPLMAGSDAPEYFNTVGFSIHDELKTTVQAGLSPFAALQTATINPATYMNMQNRTGTIEKGKEADLLLLNSNPLEDINHTRDIYGVFNQKKWMDSKSIQQLLSEAKVIGK